MTNRIKTFGADTFGAKTFDPVFNEQTGSLGISCATAAFSITGRAASLGVKMPADPAALSVTANQSALSKGYSLRASPASFVEDGKDASLEKAGITASSHGTSTATAAVVLQLVCAASVSGKSTATCAKIKSRTGRAGGAGHDVQSAGLAPKDKRKKKHETKHGYIIKYQFDGESDIFAAVAMSESVLVTASMPRESQTTVTASINEVTVVAVDAEFKRVA